MNVKRMLNNHLYGWIMACLILAGCSVKPNLDVLYSLQQEQSMEEKKGRVQPPVILVPGIVSSLLVDAQGKELWFGGVSKLLWGDYSQIALEIDEKTLMPQPSTLIASEMPPSVIGFDFYGSLFQVLEKIG